MANHSRVDLTVAAQPLKVLRFQFFFIKEQAAKLEEFEMTKQKRSKKEEDKSVEEKSTLHGKRELIEQG